MLNLYPLSGGSNLFSTCGLYQLVFQSKEQIFPQAECYRSGISIQEQIFPQMIKSFFDVWQNVDHVKLKTTNLNKRGEGIP